jgi:magnesium transporter
MENLVICMNAAAVMTHDHILTITQQLKLAKSSIPSLLSALLARESLLVSQMAIELRATLYNLDECMDKDPESIEIADIHDQKKLLRIYDTISNSQTICFDMLRSLDTNLLELIEYPMYFQLASTNASNTSQVLVRLDKTITDLSLRYDTNEQEKMNHRLGVLTILSAIFMPITFLAGIFGMNFDNMPELHFTWGYPLALGVMAATALGLYFYFKKDGWLD